MNALVPQDFPLVGQVSIGKGTVVHPRASILALKGPIAIGENNIIEEFAVIRNEASEPLVIGNENLLEVGSVFEGASMGNSNCLEVKAKVLRGARVENDCVVGAMCTLPQNQLLTSGSVLFGNPPQIRIHPTPVAKVQQTLQLKHLEYLRDILPKYNHIKAVA